MKAVWKQVEISDLPRFIHLAYARMGNREVKVEQRLVLTDKLTTKIAYRVTSSSGRTIEWLPSSRPLEPFTPKLKIGVKSSDQ